MFFCPKWQLSNTESVIIVHIVGVGIIKIGIAAVCEDSIVNGFALTYRLLTQTGVHCHHHIVWHFPDEYTPENAELHQRYLAISKNCVYPSPLAEISRLQSLVNLKPVASSECPHIVAIHSPE